MAPVGSNPAAISVDFSLEARATVPLRNELEARRALLAQLTEAQRAPAGAADGAPPPPTGRALKGRELRRVAGRLLW